MRKTKTKLLMSAMQYGGQAGYSGIQSGIMKNPLTDPLPQWQVPEVADSGSGVDRPALKKTDYGTFTTLDIGPDGLRDVYNEELVALRKKTHQAAIDYRDGKIDIEEFRYIAENYKTIFGSRKGDLKKRDEFHKSMLSKQEDEGGQFFFTGKGRLLAKVTDDNGNVTGYNYSASPSDLKKKNVTAVTYAEALRIYNETRNINIIDKIHDSSHNIDSMDTTDGKINSLAKNIGKSTIQLGEDSKGNTFVESFKFNDENGEHKFSKQNLVNSLMFGQQGTAKWVLNSQDMKAYDFIKNITAKIDDQTYNSYMNKVIKADGYGAFNDNSVNSSLDAFDAYGNNNDKHGVDDISYGNFTKKLMQEVAMFANKDDIQGIVDRVSGNKEYMKFLEKNLKEGVKIKSSEINSELIKALSLRAHGKGGYSINEELNDKDNSILKDVNIHAETKKLIVSDIFDKLNLNANITAKGEKAGISGGSSNQATKFYTAKPFLNDPELLSLQYNPFDFTPNTNRDPIKFNKKIFTFSFTDKGNEKNPSTTLGSVNNDSYLNQLSSGKIKTIDGKELSSKEKDKMIYNGNLAYTLTLTDGKTNIPIDETPVGRRLQLLKEAQNNLNPVTGYISANNPNPATKAFRNAYHANFGDSDITKDKVLKEMLLEKYNMKVLGYKTKGKYYMYKNNGVTLNDEARSNKDINNKNEAINKLDISKNDATAWLSSGHGKDSFKFIEAFYAAGKNRKKPEQKGTDEEYKEVLKNDIRDYYKEVLSRNVKVVPKLIFTSYNIVSINDLIKNGQATTLGGELVNSKKLVTSKLGGMLGETDEVDNYLSSMTKDNRIEVEKTMMKEAVDLIKGLNNIKNPDKFKKGTLIGKLLTFIKSKDIEADWFNDDEMFDKIQAFGTSDQSEADAKDLMQFLRSIKGSLISKVILTSDIRKNVESFAQRQKEGSYTNKDIVERIIQGNLNDPTKEQSLATYIQ